MTDMLQVLEQAKNTIDTVRHEFLGAFRPDEKRVYAFFEGDDDPCFYGTTLRDAIPATWKVYEWSVGGKQNVYKLKNSLDPKITGCKAVVFFVDRDLSDLLGWPVAADSNVYVTDFYSIENYVSRAEVLDRVLREQYGFGKAQHNEMAGLQKIFQRCLSQFCDDCARIMGWYLTCQQANEWPVMKNIKMNDLYFIESDGSLRRKGPADDLNLQKYCSDQTGCRLPTSQSKLHKVVRQIRRARPGHKYIRGKYVLWMFCAFIEVVALNWKQYFPSLKVKPKAHLRVQSDSAMKSVGPRMRAPASLKHFLDSTISTFAKKASA